MGGSGNVVIRPETGVVQSFVAKLAPSVSMISLTVWTRQVSGLRLAVSSPAVSNPAIYDNLVARLGWTTSLAMPASNPEAPHCNEAYATDNRDEAAQKGQGPAGERIAHTSLNPYPDEN
jgi:hypothetical protein